MPASSELVHPQPHLPSTSYDQELVDRVATNNNRIGSIRAQRPSSSRIIPADVDSVLAGAAAGIRSEFDLSARPFRRLADGSGLGGGHHSLNSGLPVSPPSTASAGRNASSGSIVVFTFALSGILLVFLLFYFLAKVCSPADDLDAKDAAASRSVGTRRPPRRASNSPRKLASGVQESPHHVLYPRRIYELQAEEGCYSSLPSMQTPEMAENVVVLKESASKSTFRHLVRKLTTSSAPSADSFGSPPDSPGLSIYSGM